LDQVPSFTNSRPLWAISLLSENIYNFYIDDNESVKKFQDLLTNRKK